MEKIKFGSLDFAVSRISFGGAAVSGEGGGYGFGLINEKDSIHLLKACHDQGINLFDTAPIYGYGMSEQRIGKAFKAMRDKAFIVSKCGITWHKDKRPHIDNSPEKTRLMLDQSLKDLGTDYIDLYFIHFPDPQTDIRETMKVLTQAKKQGKIRAIGLSNFLDPKEISKAMEIDRVDVLQAQFNLFHRDPHQQAFPYLRKEKMGFMSWGTFDKGILTGRVTRDRKFDKTDFRQADWSSWKKDESKMRAMDKINPLLEKKKHSGQELALGFVLGHPEASTAICGIKSTEQLDTALKALKNLAPRSLVDEAVAIARQELAEPAKT